VKSNAVTVTSINLADELVILLRFVNNEHFVNEVTIGKVSVNKAVKDFTECLN